jgi:hypothetical protein
MATYKVPQDVEADDKLIGPFSFRQFIYLIAVALAIVAAWGLAQLFIGLAVIPLPIILFFGTLALPLRKDQPMELYMAAIISFYLKPHLRRWDPEGIETLIEISAPKTIEVQRTKDLSQTEASQRLSYLANIVDSGGWAIRGVSSTAMNNDVYLEAQSATDVLDTNTVVAHNFDKMMSESAQHARQEAREHMIQATAVQAASPVTVPGVAPVAPVLTDDQLLSQMSQQMHVAQGGASPRGVHNHYDPYPAFHQSIIQPLNDAEHEAPSDIPTPVATPATVPTPAPTPTIAAAPTIQAQPTQKTPKKESTTSDAALTAGIMNLANNPDLSIETIAHEAERLHKKAEEESDEVVISLR